MKRVILGTLVALCMVLAWQASALSQSGTAPQIAFDIPKTDIDTLVKNAPPAK